MTTPTTTTQLGLKQYSKDVPPGWRPNSYPIQEYQELLRIWFRLTNWDDESRRAAAIYSRLELGALEYARHWVYQSSSGILTEFCEIDSSGQEVPGTSTQVAPGLDSLCVPKDGAKKYRPSLPKSGLELFLEAFVNEYAVHDQDRTWIALESFFSLSGHGTDFFDYGLKFDSRYQDAVTYAGLNMSDTAKGYLFWSKSGIDERTMSELRLKVNGDLKRWDEMRSIFHRMLKSDAATDSLAKNKSPYPLLYADDEDSYETATGFGYWTEDGYYYEFDTIQNRGWLYDEGSNTYYDADDGEDSSSSSGSDDDEDPDDEEDPEEEQEYQADANSENYKGKQSKGKGKGNKKGGGKQPKGAQCTRCGSKFHSTDQCPMNQDSGSGSHAAKDSESDYQFRKKRGHFKRHGRDGHKHRSPSKYRSSSPKPRSQHPAPASKFRKGKGKGKARSPSSGSYKPSFPPRTAVRSSSRGGPRANRRFSGYEGSSSSINFCLPSFEVGRDVDFENNALPEGAPTGFIGGGGCSRSRNQKSLGMNNRIPYGTRRLHRSMSFDAPPGLALPIGADPWSQWKPSSSVGHFPEHDPWHPVHEPAHHLEENLPGTVVDVDVQSVHTESSAGPASTSSASAPVAEINVVNIFPCASEKFQILHTIKGEEWIGILLDPGAAKGLIGSDTVLTILETILRPSGRAKGMCWTSSDAGFSGISATVQRSCGKVTFPIGLEGMSDACFRADVLGDNSSRVPGLMPLHSMIRAAAVALFNVWSNGDGIFAFANARTGELCPQRVYRTDSDHYLIRIDHFDKPVNQDLKAMMERHFTHRLHHPIKVKAANPEESSNEAPTFVIFDSDNLPSSSEKPSSEENEVFQ